MKALLDTHALIWFASGDRRLPERTRGFIDSAKNELLISVATAWEIVIKGQLGKLRLDRPSAAYVEYYIHELSLAPLQITLDHVFGVADLPSHHGDPFDRLLIAQAIQETSRSSRATRPSADMM